jgi:septal ring factor EnvC (AmiA/AmiB activator)
LTLHCINGLPYFGSGDTDWEKLIATLSVTVAQLEMENHKRDEETKREVKENNKRDEETKMEMRKIKRKIAENEKEIEDLRVQMKKKDNKIRQLDERITGKTIMKISNV